MNNPAYSSLTAFLAHRGALASAKTRTADDERTLADISAVLNAPPADDLAALDSTTEDPAARRHRERAELHLRRKLVVRGIVAG